MRLTIDANKPVTVYSDAMKKRGEATRLAAKVAGELVAREIQQRGRDDISGSGNFGSHWTNSFKSKAKRASDGVQVVTTMGGPHWKIFQEGKSIQGHPMLWIAFSNSDAAGVRASLYPGELIEINPHGLPLLVTPKDKHKAKYFGKSSVTIPKKWHLHEITAEVGVKLPQLFNDAFKGLSK